MSNKENFDFEFYGVKLATMLSEPNLSPADFIKNYINTSNKATDLDLCLLCKIIIELQSKNETVLNQMLVEIEKSYPNLAKEGFQDGWDLTYNNYRQKIKDKNTIKGLEFINQKFDIFLNQAESFGN
ncbi:hypothetical protein [Anabaena azotica]|uniref:Uncharacterized protein n=1 Tax=Anabaena azotica FACHB-119 TaxID=947527 RepID=A0ABR8DHZ2_9NOST|nr:hypothetical protein [Anabaena azotica]MBD2505388.1 hypothetical protein [Anabaena azotica FACHB-119]